MQIKGDRAQDIRHIFVAASPGVGAAAKEFSELRYRRGQAEPGARGAFRPD